MLDLTIIVAWSVERVHELHSVDLNPTDVDPAVVRALRLVRLMRLLKLLRHVKILDPLYLIVKAIQSSMSVLVWTVGMLLLLMMVVAMVNTALLENFIKDKSQDDVARLQLYESWGTFLRAYVSIFEITLANWGPQCWLLMNSVDESWGIFFILWRCCFGFAVIQVITSVFIQHTFKVASRDEEIMIQEKEKASVAYLKHLDKLFSNMDESGDGKISRQEFHLALENPRVKHWFGALEIDVSDAPRVFEMLDDGDGEIDKEEFIAGLKKVKGAAQSIDMLALRKDLQRMKTVMLENPVGASLARSPTFLGRI